MSKHNEQSNPAIFGTVSVETTDNSRNLAWYCNEYHNVTLADLAKATGANLQVMRSKAKEPIIGQVYDPDKINYGAVSDYLYKRNPNLKLETLLWEEMNTPKEKVSRATVLDYSIGACYTIRRLKGDYKIVYSTDTHVCICPIDPNDTMLRVYHKDTFKAYSPVLIPQDDTTTNYDDGNTNE